MLELSRCMLRILHRPSVPLCCAQQYVGKGIKALLPTHYTHTHTYIILTLAVTRALNKSGEESILVLHSLLLEHMFQLLLMTSCSPHFGPAQYFCTR